MHVHPLRVGLTTRPRDDVRCPQQRAIGDTGDRASVFPIGHERFAENTLADPNLFNAFDLGISESGRLAFELLERQGRKADGFAVDLPDRFKQRISRRKLETCDMTFLTGLNWPP